MKNNKGFTLIELSIVLVIISLIVAGIMGGQSLVHAAAIRAQAQQLKGFEVAYNNFTLQYDAVPGDMKNATDYWPGVVTNGDGSGALTHGSTEAWDTLVTENVHFFHHLSQAKLIRGEYDGTWEMGVGYPELKITEGVGMVAGGFTSIIVPFMLQMSNERANAKKTAALYLNVVKPAKINAEYRINYGSMSPATARSLDRKIDDGLASVGSFQSYRPFLSLNGDCLDCVDGQYLLEETEITCQSFFSLTK